MSAPTRQEILLETGTNEVEIIEFRLGLQSFGINVAKVREIIPYKDEDLTEIPDCHASVMGMVTLRSRNIPIVSLNRHLSRTPAAVDPNRRVVLICEFNELVTGFLVDGVNQIHRASWDSLKPMTAMMGGDNSRLTGSINIDDREILVLDVERIVTEIDPSTRMTYSDEDLAVENASLNTVTTREQVKLILAEDSLVIRASIEQILKKVGYQNVASFDNGKAAYDEIVRRKEAAVKKKGPLSDILTCLVTDIEMPQMDGLTLTKKVKKELALPVKVIIFSSLINEQMAIKCREVGADAYITKPKAKTLVALIDRFTLEAE
ncbi:MAG: chemotaxis protein CheV [Nitrospinae bacterium]|nr:chemotaxis protein CheV [Nitrospinota bacterium]